MRPEWWDNGQQLRVYAPGDGALAGVWAGRDNKATGRKVFSEELQEWLASPAGEHLRETHRVRLVGGTPRLVANVVRASPCSVIAPAGFGSNPDYREYRYVFDAEADNWTQERHINVMTFELFSTGPRGEFEVRHMSTRSRVRFFLMHEEELSDLQVTVTPKAKEMPDGRTNRSGD